MFSSRRDLIALFLPIMDFDEDSALNEQLNANIRIYSHINAALLGKIDLDEAIEAVEESILYNDIDNYLDEIERDLEIWEKNWRF